MALKIDTSTPEGRTVYPSEAMDRQLNGLNGGDKLAVSKIKESKAGTGYAFFTDTFFCESEEEHFEVMDFCWKNSKLGKTITAVFANPAMMDDTALLLVIQQKLKSAVVISMESEGSRWEKNELGELVFFYGDTDLDSVTNQDLAFVGTLVSSASPSMEPESPPTNPKKKQP